MGEDEQGRDAGERPAVPRRERSEVRVSVRLTVQQAKQLANQIPSGTKVSSYVRGRLGLEGGAAPKPPVE